MVIRVILISEHDEDLILIVLGEGIGTDNEFLFGRGSISFNVFVDDYYFWPSLFVF